MENEIWKNINGYEGSYQVSNLGRVKSLRRIIKCKNGVSRTINERILKQNEDMCNGTYGYLIVCLCKNCKSKFFKVHKLVLEHFINKKPKGLICCHNDGNRLNNKSDNLRWDTYKSNVQDAIKHKVFNVGEKCNLSKLSELDVKKIRKLLKENEYSNAEIAKMFSISKRNVLSIANNRIWKWLK